MSTTTAEPQSVANPAKDANLDPATSNLARIDVPKLLSDAQVKSFVSEGYLVVPQAITRAEIAALIADIIKILRGKYDCPNIKPLPDSMSDDEVMHSFLGILQQHNISPVMMDFLKHPKICGMLSQLLGYALGRRLYNAYLQSRISRKEIQALFNDPLNTPRRPLECYRQLHKL